MKGNKGRSLKIEFLNLCLSFDLFSSTSSNKQSKTGIDRHVTCTKTMFRGRLSSIQDSRGNISNDYHMIGIQMKNNSQSSHLGKFVYFIIVINDQKI